MASQLYCQWPPFLTLLAEDIAKKEETGHVHPAHSPGESQTNADLCQCRSDLSNWGTPLAAEPATKQIFRSRKAKSTCVRASLRWYS